MDEKVRILIVEDSPPDAELAEFEIRQVVPNSEFVNVKTKKSFIDSLEKFQPHVIVSDYLMPKFDGMTALKITLEKNVDTPFILLTGSMNEDTAVKCMKMGATDYIIKEHIKRLGGSVKNALEQRNVILEKKSAQDISRQSVLDQEILLETANQLLLSKDLLDVYQIVFKAVQKLTTKSYIMVVGNNQEENTQKIFYHQGFEKYLKWLDGVFHISQNNLKIPMNQLNEEELKNYNMGKLLLVPGGLFDLSARSIPKKDCYLIEKALQIKEVYCIGFPSMDYMFGIVALLKKEKGIPEKAELLESIMGQASQAIQKLYAIEQTKLNQEKLQSLLFISQLKTDSIQDFQDRALDEIVKLMNSKYGYIYYYYEDKKHFVPISLSKNVLTQCKLNKSKSIFELENAGIWGGAVRQRKPIIINHFTEPNPLKKGYSKCSLELKNFLIIPVIYKDSIVAVVGVANKDTDYTESDVNQLTIMMDTIWKITKQKETDLLLHENKEKYKAIMEQSLDNIYLADIKSMKILEANPALCRLLGYGIEEMEKLTTYDILDYSKEQIQNITQNLIKQKKLYLGERNYKKKLGKLFL